MNKPILFSKTFRDAYLETWHRETFHLWLDDTLAPCNHCGIRTDTPLVERVWFNPATQKDVIVGILCHVCDEMYQALVRSDRSTTYWYRRQMEDARLNGGGFDG